MTTQCNLLAPLTLDKVNLILEKLYVGLSHNPDNTNYDAAIRHYHEIKKELQEGKE